MHTHIETYLNIRDNSQMQLCFFDACIHKTGRRPEREREREREREGGRERQREVYVCVGYIRGGLPVGLMRGTCSYFVENQINRKGKACGSLYSREGPHVSWLRKISPPHKCINAHRYKAEVSVSVVFPLL